MARFETATATHRPPPPPPTHRRRTQSPKEVGETFLLLDASPEKRRGTGGHILPRGTTLTGEGPKRGGEEEAISAETSLGGGAISFFSPTTLSLR
jgi:hypothetical protein